MSISLQNWWKYFPVSVRTFGHACLFEEQSNHSVTYEGMTDTGLFFGVLAGSLVLWRFNVDHVEHCVTDVSLLVPNDIYFCLFVENEKHHASYKQILKSRKHCPSDVNSIDHSSVAIMTASTWDIESKNWKHGGGKDYSHVCSCNKSIQSGLSRDTFHLDWTTACCNRLSEGVGETDHKSHY